MPDSRGTSDEAVVGALVSFMRPRSIAVIGASQDLTKLTGRPVAFLKKHGFRGRILPVNPNASCIAGYTCFPTIESLPPDVDLAAILLPAGKVIDAVEQCGRKGVKSIVLFSSGFSELGASGKVQQDLLVATALRYGMRVLGPNGAALVDVQHGMALSFMAEFANNDLLPGNISFSSQSGAFVSAALKIARDKGFGFNYLVHTGNEADIGLADLLEHFVDDDSTRVITSFVEAINEPERVLKALRRAADASKAVIVLKIGSSSKGASVAASHTGSITGDAAAQAAAYRQLGVVQVADFNELIETATLFSRFDLPRKTDVAVIGSGSGGAAELMADLAERCSVRLAEFDTDFRNRLTTLLGPFSITVNPIDVAGTSANLDDEVALFGAGLEMLADQPSIGIVVVALPVVIYVEKMAQRIVEILQRTDKAIVPILVAGPNHEEAAAIFREHRIPFFSAPEPGLKAVAAFQRYADFTRLRQRQSAALAPARTDRRDQARAFLVKARTEGRETMTLYEASSLLGLYGLKVPKQGLARSLEEVRTIASHVGFPLAMKIESRVILHKTEIGGVILNVRSLDAADQAYSELMARASRQATMEQIDGVLVQAMMVPQCEIIVGSSRKSSLGHVMLVGMGGVLVELLGEFALRLPPVDADMAREMLTETRASRLLAGFRGKAKGDLAAVVEAIVGFSEMIRDIGDLVEELEMNPLFALEDGKGAVVADALFTLR